MIGHYHYTIVFNTKSVSSNSDRMFFLYSMKEKLYKSYFIYKKCLHNFEAWIAIYFENYCSKLKF